MFKFFRQYQSYLLVVGGSLLMIVFLIEPALRMFSPSREKMVIGRLDGAKITFGDQDTAGADLYVLDRLGIWPNAREAIEPLAWMLAMHDARKHGLEVSQLEISQMLALRGLDDIALKNTAIQMGVSTGLIRRAVGHWLLVEEYQELALGLRTVSPLTRTQAMLQAQQLQNQAYAQISKTMEEGGSAANISPETRQAVEKAMLEASQLAWSVTPSPRLSQPLVQHFLHDQGAKARLSIVRIPAERSMDKFPAPREAELMSLFEEYKDILPGEGKPYGFGYRQPNRVKLEYLEIAPESLMSVVQVDEADALAHYQANKQQYLPANMQVGEVKVVDENPLPYAQVRTQIIAELRQKRAGELGSRLLKEAQGILEEDSRKLPKAGGYWDTAGWVPKSLAQVAAELQDNFKVLPTVVRLDGNWLTPDQLAQLPGIGSSRVYGGANQTLRQQHRFTDYVMSARELSPSPENPLLTMRLQTSIAADPMVDDRNHLYLFRLIAAEPARSPASLEEVRPQVERDARLLTAYQSLSQDTDSWLQRLETQNLDELAQSLGLVRKTTGFFQRREVRAEQLAVPAIPGLNAADTFTDQAFVDMVFDRAETLAQGDGVLATVRSGRSLAIPVASKLSLYLVTIEDYLPMNQREYDQTLSMYPRIAMWIHQLLTGEINTEPLALGPLKKRTGFVEEGRSAEDEESQP